MRIDLAWDEPWQEPEPTCARCEAPESWCRCLDILICPQCGEESEDVEGFGAVFHCEDCGYCVHPATTDGVCDRCGRRYAAA